MKGKTEKFAFLSLEGSQIMLEEIHTGGWNVGKLHYPFGRGVNFSMEIDDIDARYQRFVFHRYPLYRTLTNQSIPVQWGIHKTKRIFGARPRWISIKVYTGIIDIFILRG